MKRLSRIAVLTAVAAAGLPAVAPAHVTLQPNEVPAGGFKRLDVRVPTERDDASTKKVEVQFPAGFISVSHQPVPGWDVNVKMAKLAKPVEVFGETRTERVDTITFSTDGQGIRPGEFQDFGISVAVPDKAGSTLTFKAIQTYSGGEVVRWIGTPDSEQPAPQVKLVAAPAEDAAAHDSDTATAASPAAADDDDDDGEGDTLAVIALVVGALGLLAGLAGLATARRARSTTTA